MSSQENQPGSNLASQEEIKNPTTSPEESIEAANEKKLSDTLEQSGSKVFLVTNEAKKVTPGQIARIENGGGSSEELNKRTSEVVQKIEAVNVETNQKVLGELMTQLSDWKAKMEKGSKSAPRAIKYTVDEVTKFCQKNGLPVPQEILDATPAPKEKPAKAEQSKVLKNEIPAPVEDKQSNVVVEAPVVENTVAQPIIETPKVEEYAWLKNDQQFQKNKGEAVEMFDKTAEGSEITIKDHTGELKQFTVTKKDPETGELWYEGTQQNGEKYSAKVSAYNVLDSYTPKKPKEEPQTPVETKQEEKIITHVEQTIVEQPVIEPQPVVSVEQPVVVETVAEQPVVEQSVIETPIVEKLKQEPVVEQPIIEVKVEAPIEQPVIEPLPVVETPKVSVEQPFVFQRLAPIERIEASKMNETVLNLVMKNQEIDKLLETKVIDTDDIRAVVEGRIRTDQNTFKEISFIVEGNKADFSQKLKELTDESIKKLGLIGDQKIESLITSISITGEEERSKNPDDRNQKMGSRTRRIVGV